MCRSTERALQLAVAHHPDARSWAAWATAFDPSGQGALYEDVVNFADDEHGRVALTEHLAAVAAQWYAGFSIKLDAGVTNT